MIDEILRADLDAPRKRRHTLTRIFHRLVEEHGADASYGVVRHYVADRKPEILVESGKALLEAFVPRRQLPPCFGPSAHRRFTEWSRARVWGELHRPVLDELGARGALGRSRCAIDSVNMRATKGRT